MNLRSILIMSVIALLATGGCGKKKDKPKPVDAGTTIGIPVISADQYKPVVGRYGGRIIRATLGEPKSFNPITSGEASTSDYTNRIFEGLTTTDPFTGKVVPLLAESWDVAADHLTWTFHLRHGVTFNDGSPFTADDVVFTWNDLIYDSSRPGGTPPRWPCSIRDSATFGGKAVRVEKVDEYTVRFITPVPVAIWDMECAAPILSKKKYAATAADGTFGSAMSKGSASGDIVGTGAFMLGAYEPGNKVALKRSKRYWKKDSAGNQLPYLDGLDFVIMKELNLMLLSFERGEIDYFAMRTGKDIAELRPRETADKFSLYALGPTSGTFFAAFNMNEDAVRENRVPAYKVKWFRDQRFRQAISHTIDRDNIVHNVMRNLAVPLAAPFTIAPGPFRQDGIPVPALDLAKAKALLEDMGLKDRDGNGILEDEQGHEVRFTIYTNSGNETRQDICEAIRTDLSKVGIKANTLFLEFNLLTEKMDQTHDWECLVMALSGGLEPNFGANVWKSSGRLHLWWPNQTTPSTNWEKRIDELFETGVTEFDHARRKEIYREWIDIVSREQPMVYLVCPTMVAALRNRFGNIFPAPVGLLFHNEEEMFVLEGK